MVSANIGEAIGGVTWDRPMPLMLFAVFESPEALESIQMPLVALAISGFLASIAGRRPPGVPDDQEHCYASTGRPEAKPRRSKTRPSLAHATGRATNSIDGRTAGRTGEARQ